MTVWLRLLFIILTSFFRKKFAGPKDFIENSFPLDFRVWLTEADGSLLNNARYFTFTEVARMDLMLRSGIFKVALNEKIIPLVKQKYLAPFTQLLKGLNPLT